MSPELNDFLDGVVQEVKTDPTIPAAFRNIPADQLKRCAASALVKYVCKDDDAELAATLQLTGMVLAICRAQLDA